MRKLLLILLAALIVFSLPSCSERPDAEAIIFGVVSAVGAEGVIYSPSRAEGEDGYIDEALFSRIYITDGPMPESFAVFLNSHADYGAECGVFVASDAAELARLCEMCTERLELLDRGDRGFLLVQGRVVFYSTMTEPERVRRIFLEAAR